jgi:hypothetical protein
LRRLADAAAGVTSRSLAASRMVIAGRLKRASTSFSRRALDRADDKRAQAPVERAWRGRDEARLADVARRTDEVLDGADLARSLLVAPDKIHAEALERAVVLAYALQVAGFGEGVSVAPRFVRLSQYLNDELHTVLAAKNLARAKLSLCEEVAPMSYHVAVARFGLPGVALMDVIFDTTDSELNCAPFAHVVFSPMVDPLLDAITQSNAALRREWFGTRVQGF